jgi:hypothetical protein
LVQHLPRAALWVVVLLLLAGTLATIATAQATTPNYTLTGFATQPNGAGVVPAGATVDLINRATDAIYTTSITGSGGQFNFTTSSTGGALVPGYWALYVPPQGNLSVAGCRSCNNFGVFSVNQNPVYTYYSATQLTSTSSPASVPNVNVVYYNAQLSGTVRYNGNPVGGAAIQLLSPQYNDFVLASNSSLANGTYVLKVPAGSWVLKTLVQESPPLYNYTALTVTAFSRPVVNIGLGTWLFQGSMLQSTAGNPPVASSGNVTLWDATNSYIYSNPTPPGGFYSIGSYPAGFTGGTGQTFQVVLSAVGYSTSFYSQRSQNTPYSQNVVLAPLAPSQRGVYQTTLNFSGINVSSGTGKLNVWTNATLGNDTVLQNLPNATIAQLWGQLGLDFQHTTSPTGTTLLTSLVNWENAAGAWFPAVQAGTAINGTGFLASPQSGNVGTNSTTCTATCTLSSGGGISLGWYQSFALNGSVVKNSGAYTLSFNFAHPTSTDTYNYSIVLPTGYALAAGTSAPAQTRLVAGGPDNTWTKFTLVSLPSSANGGTASFSIVKYANLTAIVNASVSNFAFSSQNVLNSTNGNYTVVVGTGQNVTFSALNSTYPAGTNGTTFRWSFGDGNTSTVTTPTTNHTYAAARATPYAGTLTVTSSGGLVNSTKFNVYVAQGPVTAAIQTNASAYQNRTSGSVPYVFVNWSTVLRFNASASTAQIAPGATIPGVLSVASYTITAKGYTTKANYSEGQGAYFGSNYSWQFLGAGVYYNNHTTIGGSPVYFKGWQYNVSLTVWDGTGQSASTSLIVLVVDTQKPTSAFQILNSAGKPVTGSGVVAGSNLTAKVQFNGANATDPNNGSLTSYYWLLTNSGNDSVHTGINQTGVKPYPTLWLAPQTKPYTVNLTVTDLNGNKGYTTQSLSVTVNSTTNVIMSATNLTGPSTLNVGNSYTYWVNVTVGGGSKAVAQNVQVLWSISSPGSSVKSAIAGTPGSVKWYNYSSSGVVNSVSFASGTIPSMSYNTTYRAEITWSPIKSGNWVLYVNATASNEFSGNYPSGPQQISMTITVNPNQLQQDLEYVAIAAAVILVILAIIFLYRRRGRRSTTTTTTSRSSRSGIERKSSSKETTEDEDAEDDET